MEELVLPEKYNGLGYRNLISIYLKLIDFRETWLKELSEGKNIEPIHIVFIEEPEAAPTCPSTTGLCKESI